MKVNLGSGKYPLEGYVNVDQYEQADVRQDLRELGYRDVEEVRMSHLLEHISWRSTNAVLEHVRRWMQPGGVLIVEVPDMDLILARGTKHSLWFKYVYGDQSTPGEYHLAGFNASMLRAHLLNAGWKVREVRAFKSRHPGREGMPCLEAVASA